MYGSHDPSENGGGGYEKSPVRREEEGRKKGDAPAPEEAEGVSRDDDEIDE